MGEISGDPAIGTFLRAAARRGEVVRRSPIDAVVASPPGGHIADA